MILEVDKRVRRALASLRQAFRAVMDTVNSDGPVQLAACEGLAGESLPDAELFQHYGLTSSPPAGTMAVILPLGGKTSHGILIATEHGSYRLKSLKSGEVALYSDEGDVIALHRGRVIDITTQTLNIVASTAVNIDTPTVNIKHQLNVAEKITGQGGMAVAGGDGVKVDGSMEVSKDVTAGGKSLAHHKHLVLDNITDEPIG
jgi:phage baseplate assembly protein V